MQAPTNILFLLTQDLNSPSGLGRYLPFASALRERGYTVRIAALHPDFKNLAQTHQEINGVPVDYVAPMHVMKQGNTKQYYRPHQLMVRTLYATWQLSSYARRFPADIIHVCKPHPMNSIAGIAGSFLRSKQRLYLDCDDYEAASNRFSASWQRRLVEFFEDGMPSRADLVTSNTYFTINRLRSLGIPEQRLTYLPNGVDRARFAHIPEENLNILREQLGLSGKRVIVYVGSLSLPSHPVDLLLKAFRQILARNPDVHLLIVGGGEDLPGLQAQAAEYGIAGSVCFTGRIPPGQIPMYYRLGNVSVDPVYDTPAAAGRAPLKMFESWSAGVPFVTMDVGDRGLLAGSPPAALLARAGNADDLAGAIERVITRPELASELCERGRRQVEEFYWDRIVERTGWIYQTETPRMDG